MIKKYFDNQSVLAILFICIGLFCSYLYPASMSSMKQMKTQTSLVLDFITMGPFALGILLGSRILSDDKKPEKDFWYNDHLFFVFASLLMAISMFGLSVYISSKGWFVLNDRKNSHDLTSIVLSFLGLVSCFILYKVSPRLFGSIESIFLPMFAFWGVTYIFANVTLPKMINYNGAIHIIVICIVYINLKHTTLSKRYLFLACMFLGYLGYFLYM